jgi:hypothetical protein
MLSRLWMLPGAVVALIAGHGIVYYSLRHTNLSAAVVSGVIILMAIKHLEFLTPCTPCSSGDLVGEERGARMIRAAQRDINASRRSRRRQAD